MEKQKIFWVILSVSIFLVVLIIVGIFVVKQKPAAVTSTETVSPLADMGTRIFELGQDKPQEQAQTQGTSTEPEVLKFVIGEETPEKLAEKTSPLPMPLPQLPPLAQAAETPAKQPAAEAVKSAPQEKAAPAKAEAPKASPPKTAAAPRTEKVTEYWIQTGSYKSQTRAEDLSRLLTSKGLPGRVLASSIEAETYFRVRIGPYTNKGEADKFLRIVKQIQGLESSYISSVSATRTVN